MVPVGESPVEDALIEVNLVPYPRGVGFSNPTLQEQAQAGVKPGYLFNFTAARLDNTESSLLASTTAS